MGRDEARELLSLVADKPPHGWLRPWVEFLAKGWADRGADWLKRSLTILERRNA